ncbi:hypothetical protein RA2_01993 [Roseovarius sp. A-2]|uniref:hypothetical protein n=1 Tax=Roseovarius sp. A-2 TaxID=1570360 RepID=UPI0009B55260|nr:hypothetical protein [Roseovarius sp. A-2]GAW34936.1 hypothetical protein RA2_01993 [Roseovarius sp. A-2]
MDHVSQVAGLVSRLYLAFFFALHAAYHAAPQAIQPFTQHADLTGAPLLDAAIVALLSLIAIWLVLGLRSRVVAVLGFVICSAALLLQGGSWTHTPVIEFWSWDRMIAIGAVLILSITGGGMYRLHAGGWRLKDCL